MRIEIESQPRLWMTLTSPRRSRRHRLSLLASLAASVILLNTQVLSAATPPPPAARTHRASVPAHRQARARAHTRRSRRSTPPAEAAHAAAPLPQAPAQPKLPNWPVNNPPNPASVAWNSHQLSIKADNSSLQQILNDVATDTGAKIAGLSSDERIFGSYGPGQVRDVLSQLLDGSGYDVMIIGGQDPATPLRIVLSGTPKGGTALAPIKTASGGNKHSGPVAPPQPDPQQPPMIHDVFGPRTQREMMQQRQQEIEQQMQERQVRPN